ncbi:MULTISPECIES: hypothetical protein [Streptomyces]|uniref:Uncharacterized protein n=1 Tax=Streptomyces dengpaensis TaxID=2049881 RepID=A0ABN5HUV9_9ACTN|nr:MULTISPECIES: hypothetical protein [Streptomyces]AVH54910.1 hypothetical protein C4B68_02845 [Streptomyces dengpaensis]PIB08213.1 hypothetical protein B1C81_14830 [Streptomyces sp. HG99]
MDSTHTALRRVTTRLRTGSPCAELTNDYRSHPPIYAQLVVEWRAKGRLVPERREAREVLWASFAAPAPQADEADPESESEPQPSPGPVPAVPVPRGLPRWVRTTPR